MECTVGAWCVQWWSTLPMQSEVSQGSISLDSESDCSLCTDCSVHPADHQPSEAVVEVEKVDVRRMP